MSTQATVAIAPCPGTRLPEIPGGWAGESIRIEDRRFQLVLPADPDAFLEDPAVIAASQRDDYMPYWPYLWPASRTMAAAVLCAPWMPGTRALEIGCGLGLVGLAALARGMHVTFSDYDAMAVDLAARNAAGNGFAAFDRMLIDWRNPPKCRFPLILGCELLYQPQNHRHILRLVETMLSEKGLCWIGDPGRRHTQAFLDLVRRNCRFTTDLFDERGRRLSEIRIGRFQIIRLRRR